MNRNQIRPPHRALWVHLAGSLLSLALLAGSWPGTAWASDALKNGKRALDRNDLAAAVPLLQQAVSQEPTNEEAHTALAMALIRSHRYHDASTEIDAAGKLSPDSPTVPYLQGQLAESQDDWEGAITKYKAALARRSKYADASYALGLALRHQGHAPEALAELNRGLDFAKENEAPKFLAGIGLALMDLDSLSAAADSATRAVALDPDNALTHMSLGEIYLKRGVYALSKQSFERAAQIDSLNPVAFLKLGLSNYYSQSYNDALQAFKTASALDSLYPEPQYWIGHLYALAGVADHDKYSQAVPYLRNYTRWRPRDWKGWLDLGDALYHEVGSDTTTAREAANALEQTVQMNSKDTRAYSLLVKDYAYRLHDLDKAFSAYEKLQAAGGKLSTEDMLLVGSLYTSQHNFVAADSIFSQAIQADSTKPDPWYKLAESKFVQGDYKGAIPYLLRRMQMEDSSGAVTGSTLGLKPYVPSFMLGQAYNQIGVAELSTSPAAAAAMFDSAVVPLKRALSLNPEGDDAAKVHLELGTAYVKGSAANRSLAPDEFHAAYHADSTSKSAASALYNLGYIAYGEKRFSDAANLLEQATTVNPKRLDILVLLSASYVATKDFDRAKASALKGLALDPNNKLLKQIVNPPQVRKVAPKAASATTATPPPPGKGAKLPEVKVPEVTATAKKK